MNPALSRLPGPLLAAAGFMPERASSVAAGGDHVAHQGDPAIALHRTIGTYAGDQGDRAATRPSRH